MRKMFLKEHPFLAQVLLALTMKHPSKRLVLIAVLTSRFTRWMLWTHWILVEFLVVRKVLLCSPAHLITMHKQRIVMAVVLVVSS